MYDIIELHRMLQEARGEDPDRKIKARIARVKDIELLSKGNECSSWDNKTMADALNVPISMVEAERARIDREERSRRTFLATGDLELPDQYVGISILK